MTKNGAGPLSGNTSLGGSTASLGRTALVAGILLVIAIGVYGWASWQNSSRVPAMQANTEIVNEAERLLSIMALLESATRGYVITGRSEFLDPYRQGAAGLEAQFNRMESVWAPAGADPARLARLRSLSEDMVRFEARVIEARDRDGGEAAGDLVRSGGGKAIMDELRALIATVQERAVTRIAQAQALENRIDLFANLAFLAAILSAAALAILAFRRHIEGRRATDLLGSVLANSPVSIGFTNREGEVERLNEAFRTARGEGDATIETGMRLADVFPAERAKIEGMLRATLDEGAIHNGVELRSQGGATFLASVYPLRTEGRKKRETVGAGVVLVNATKRLAAERGLSNAMERFRSLVEATASIVWSTPGSGEFGGDQPQWSAFTGQGRSQYSGYGWLDAVHPDDRDASRAAWADATKNRSVYRIEHRIRRADGEWRDMMARAVPILERDGTIREWIGTHTDITDQKRTAAELGETNLQFRTIADNIPQLAWTANSAGEIFWYNRRWFDYTGRSMEEMRGLGWRAVHDPAHLERVVAGLKASFSAGEPWEDIFPLRGADGSYRWFLSQAVPIHDPQGRILRWFGTNTDITSQRAAEEELAAAKEAAESANRAKSQFIANMSHELRTPLSAVIGYAEMLEEEVEDLGEAHLLSDLKKIEQNARHLLSLINDVLDLSKIEAERMDVYAESFELSPVLDEVGSTVGSLIAKKDNRLEIRRGSDLGTLHTDQVKLRQCLINLLSNASKFTENGVIALSAERHVDDGRDWIVFEVADTGIGMSADQLGRLFERFTQADASTTRKFGGTGLGLAITRAFCRLLGGDIGVRSVEGEGTVFTIRIPARVAVPEEPATDAGHETVPDDARRGAGVVLAVDDDPHARELMIRFLSREGFTVRAAADGAAGLEMARLIRPDVILLDVTMPRMDGWSVLAELKADPELASIPVVMITIIDEHNLGYTLGASDYLLKPVEWSRLKAVMDRFRTPDNATVLAVDDDEDALARTVTMLERQHLAVATARNGLEALEELKRGIPGVILLDLVMPEMDGFAFLRELRAEPRYRSIPVIVLSSKDLSTEEARLLQSQADQVLAKGDTDLRELAADIRVMVNQRLTQAAAPAVLDSETV